MKRRWGIFVVIVALLGAAVQPARADDTQLLSTMLGAGLGGWAGSNIGKGSGRLAATGAGVFIGGMVGNEIGRPSRPGYAAPAYAGSTYGNDYPDDMFGQRVVVYRPNYVAPPDPPAPPPVTYIDEDSGAYCREFSQTVRVGGRLREAFGTACLQPDGSWHIVQ